MYPQPGSEAQPLHSQSDDRAARDDDELGVDCAVCGTRLHVSRRLLGESVLCPDCDSPVLVKPRSKLKPPAPREYDDAELPQLSPPVDVLVPSVESLSSQLASETASDAARDSRSAGKQGFVEDLLKKAKAELAEEAAEEREASAERFTRGLFAFFADRRAIGRLVALAASFELMIVLAHWADGVTLSGDASAIFGMATSLVAAVLAGLAGLAFLAASAACGWAVTRDSSGTLAKIEAWPGIDVRAWDPDARYVVSATLLAALPGILVGIILPFVDTFRAAAFTGSLSFVALFPLFLLSMLETESALSPVCNEVWSKVPERPSPWSLTYLMTGFLTMIGLVATLCALAQGFFAGLVWSLVMVACMMLYFRTVGRLIGFLADRDQASDAASGGNQTR